LETWAGGEKEWRWACEKRKEGEKEVGRREVGPRVGKKGKGREKRELEVFIFFKPSQIHFSNF
jgi:hypothetical protein